VSEKWVTNFFLKPVEFVAGAAISTQIPDFTLPEIAFIGRSNVGKSSLMNALCARKALARVSKTPGRTRQLNFFNIDDLLMLVDVPGYGYAKAPKRDIKNWQGTLFSYLKGRRQLARAFILIDSRHGIKPVDADIFAMLNEAAVSFQVVLTKTDFISETARISMVEQVEEALKTEPAAHPSVLTCSSAKKLGLDGLRQAVLDAAMITKG
jgi:GTP-binding protein